jgi:hypothetical protein
LQYTTITLQRALSRSRWLAVGGADARWLAVGGALSRIGGTDWCGMQHSTLAIILIYVVVKKDELYKKYKV